MRFLTTQPEVLLVEKKEGVESTVITVKLDPRIHPARKIHLTHYIHDNLDPDMNISIVEQKITDRHKKQLAGAAPSTN